MMHFLRFLVIWDFSVTANGSRHRITCIMRAKRAAILNPTKSMRYDFIPAA